jgi:hypothetical protein
MHCLSPSMEVSMGRNQASLVQTNKPQSDHTRGSVWSLYGVRLKESSSGLHQPSVRFKPRIHSVDLRTIRTVLS